MPVVASTLLADAFVAEEIERALSPYADALDAEELRWMRAALAMEIADDAELQALLGVVHPRGTEVSGERVRPGIEWSDEEPIRGAG